MSPAVARLGWTVRPGEGELESQLRGDLIGALGILANDAATQDRAQGVVCRLREESRIGGSQCDPGVGGDPIAYRRQRPNSRNSLRDLKTLKRRRRRLAISLLWQILPTPGLSIGLLDLTISGDVRTQNSPYLMRGILLNKHARDRAWSFMKSHWNDMNRQYPDNAIPRMCEGVVGLVSTELEKDVINFFAAHPVKQGSKQIEQHLERLRVSVACQERWRSFLRS